MSCVLVKNQLKSTLDESFDQVALSQAKLLLIQAQSGIRETDATLLRSFIALGAFASLRMAEIRAIGLKGS